MLKIRLGGEELPGNIFGLLPETGWTSLSLLVAGQGGCGPVLSRETVAGFLEEWTRQGLDASLGGAHATRLGFAAATREDGRATAVAILGGRDQSPPSSADKLANDRLAARRSRIRCGWIPRRTDGLADKTLPVLIGLSRPPQQRYAGSPSTTFVPSPEFGREQTQSAVSWPWLCGLYNGKRVSKISAHVRQNAAAATQHPTGVTRQNLAPNQNGRARSLIS